MNVYVLLASAIGLLEPSAVDERTAVSASLGQRAIPASCIVAPSRPTRVSISVAERVATMRRQHATLRRPIPSTSSASKTAIYVMLSSSHRSTTRLSFIATRDRKGVWSINRAGKTTFTRIGGSPDMSDDIEPETITVLPRERGAEIDRLIADPCLYAQPFMADDYTLPPVGQWETSLAVVAPRRMYAGYSFGPLPGPGGRLVSAITGW